MGGTVAVLGAMLVSEACRFLRSPEGRGAMIYFCNYLKGELGNLGRKAAQKKQNKA